MSWSMLEIGQTLAVGSRGCVGQAGGSEIIHFCGLQKRGDGCPGPTAASGSCEQCILPSNCLRSDGALDNVGIDFDTPIAHEAFESGPPGDGGADRPCEFGFFGQT